jgi:hypothetical protein
MHPERVMHHEMRAEFRDFEGIALGDPAIFLVERHRAGTCIAPEREATIFCDGLYRTQDGTPHASALPLGSRCHPAKLELAVAF